MFAGLLSLFVMLLSFFDHSKYSNGNNDKNQYYNTVCSKFYLFNSLYF